MEREEFFLGELAEEAGCCDLLHWRCSWPAEMARAERLLDLGYRPHCRHPALAVYRHPDEHEVVLVPRTGRVQIRVDLGVEREKRRQVALAIHADLRRVLLETPVAAMRKRG